MNCIVCMASVPDTAGRPQFESSGGRTLLGGGGITPDLIVMLDLKQRVDALCPGREAHDALYDATASLVLLEYLIEQFKLAESATDILIHPDNTEWHRLRRQ